MTKKNLSKYEVFADEELPKVGAQRSDGYTWWMNEHGQPTCGDMTYCGGQTPKSFRREAMVLLALARWMEANGVKSIPNSPEPSGV